MSLYPSLEDMQVDQAIQAQNRAKTHGISPGIQTHYPAHPPGHAAAPYPALSSGASLYPTLGDDYMGLSLRQADLPPNLGAVVVSQTACVPQQNNRLTHYKAPVSGATNVGIIRSEIKNGLRMVTICHDQKGKFGLKLKSIDTGIFVCFVSDGSPAAMVGIRFSTDDSSRISERTCTRFGDQIVQVNGENCAGMSSDKAISKLKKSDPLKCELVIRDRPFERTVTMQKDSSGHVGFLFKNGKITDLVKDSSAARNGLLTEHHLCEINGQNVVGMKDKNIGEVLKTVGSSLTITIMPEYVFEHIVKRVSKGLFKQMDHSIPDV
jgi:syntenin-1